MQPALSVTNLRAGSIANPLAGIDPNYNAALGADVGTSTPQSTAQAKTQVAGLSSPTSVLGATTGGTGYATTGIAAPAGPSPLFQQQQQGVLDSSNLAAQNAALSQGTSISDYINSLQQNQSNLDNQSVQNLLAKQSGNQGILDWVGQGIRSGGVMLANKNASNSSAGDELARAYSTLGRQQAAGVNQQFASAQDQVAQSEKAMQSDIAQHINDLPAWKTQTVNSIVSQAQQQLGAIDQTMAYMSLPDRVDMEAQKQQITQSVLAQLQGLDQALAKAQGVSAAPTSDLQARANTLFQAGTAPANAFNYTTTAPAAFQDTGPASSDLPIFTLPTSTKDQTQPALA